MVAPVYYVIVTESGPDVRYSHGGAVSLLHDVFWGPEHTLRFVRTRGRSDRWRPDSWVEAVACVDLTRRTLLLHGGAYEDSHIIPVRRAFLTMLAATWAGWSVRWANYGLFDVLGHLGLDLDLVRGDASEADPLVPDWDDVEDGEDMNTVLSVRTASGSLVLRGLRSGLLEDLLAGGPTEIIAGAHPRTRLAPGDFPMSGLHLDIARREAGYWTADSLGDPADPPYWPEWTVTCWFDRYEEQLARTGGTLRLPVPVQADITTRILGFLAPRKPLSPRFAATGRFDRPIEPDVLLRRQMLAAGLAALPPARN